MLTWLNPKNWLAVIGVFFLGVAIGGFGVWRTYGNMEKAKDAKQYQQKTETVIAATDKLEEKRDERKKTYTTIRENLAQREPDRRICFSDDRLRIANQAISPATFRLDKTLSSTPTAK